MRKHRVFFFHIVTRGCRDHYDRRQWDDTPRRRQRKQTDKRRPRGLVAVRDRRGRAGCRRPCAGRRAGPMGARCLPLDHNGRVWCRFAFVGRRGDTAVPPPSDVRHVGAAAREDPARPVPAPHRAVSAGYASNPQDRGGQTGRPCARLPVVAAVLRTSHHVGLRQWFSRRAARVFFLVCRVNSLLELFCATACSI